MKRLYLLLSILAGLLVLNGCSNSSNEFSEAVSNFKGKFGNTTSFYFYNSTLKMVNFTQDSSFNKMVKDIRKLRVITFKSEKDDLDRQQISKLTTSIHMESYVDMMQISKDGFNILIFMQKHHEKPVKFIGIGYDTKSFFIVDLVGSISSSVITSVANGSFNISGISSVLNFTGPDNFKKGHKHKKGNGDDSGNQ
jgi:hypothetical protein